MSNPTLAEGLVQHWPLVTVTSLEMVLALLGNSADEAQTAG